MQIKTEDAVRLGFVLDENRAQLDHTSYIGKSSFDIELKEILVKDDQEHIISQPSIDKLSPQDSAYIISKQYIRVPRGYVAYVFLKNRMSQRGLLALNTGIIDQNYYGPISTLILNLSKMPAAIPDQTSAHDFSFFRIVFHKIDSNAPIDEDSLEFPEENSAYDYQKYVSYRKRELTALPKTFLNADEIEKRIKNEVTEKTKDFTFNRLIGGAALLAFLLTLVPIARDSLFSWQFDFNKVTEQSIKNEYEAKMLKMEVDSLKSEISALKKSIEKPKANNSRPLFTQNLNITTPSNIERGAVSEEVVE